MEEPEGFMEDKPKVCLKKKSIQVEIKPMAMLPSMG